MSSKRTIFFVLFQITDEGIEMIASVKLLDLDPNDNSSTLLEIFIERFSISQDGSKQDIGTINDYNFFDYDCSKLPEGLLIREIPFPGVLFALRNIASEEEAPEEAFLQLVKLQMEHDKDYNNFLNSIESRFIASPLTIYDVFISYAEEDSSVADEIRILLVKKGLRCFMAKKDIRTGTIWREEIRSALHLSRTVVLLLTPNSVSSNWVMCEAGAFWALRKPIIPGYMFVNINDIPELISESQCIKIDSAIDRKKLVNDVVLLCNQ